MQTKKLNKSIPIVLFGKEFWHCVLNFDALVEHGTNDTNDLDLFLETVSVDEAFNFITCELEENALGRPGAYL